MRTNPRSLLLSISYALIFSNFSNSQNTSLSFDGTNDFVKTDYGGITGSAARTVEAWIKTTSVSTGNQMVITDWGDMASGHRFTLCINQYNSIKIDIGGGGISGVTPVNNGAWHHVAVVYDPIAFHQYSLYLDGVIEMSGNISIPINTSSINSFQIGRRIDGVDYFDGEIDEVRVFNYPRTSIEIIPEQFSEYCNVPVGLEAYYRFNNSILTGGSGAITTVIDNSVNTNCGTLYNFNFSGTATHWVTGPLIGLGGKDSIISVKSCSLYVSNAGNIYSSTGVFYELFTGSSGCDSTLKIDFELDLPVRNLQVIACDSFISPSGKYTWKNDGYYVDTISVPNSCDSVLNITLNMANIIDTIFITECGNYTTPDGKNSWSLSGKYPITYSGIHGCDSIVVYDITIIPTTYAKFSVSACHSYTAPSGNKVWFNSGNYVDTLTNSNGCDSIITIKLEILAIDVSVHQDGEILTANMDEALYQWNTCTNANVIKISGENKHIFIAYEVGDYSVTVSKNGCQDTSICYSVSYANTSNYNLSLPKIYPNPTSGNFTINSIKNYGTIKLEILNLNGELILERFVKMNSNIDINEHLPTGIYIVKLVTTSETFIEKVMIL